MFSSPIGESTFSTIALIYDIVVFSCFRPLSGNLLSLPVKYAKEEDGKRFSSPIGESTFSTVFSVHFTTPLHGFRPLSGNLLSLHCRN